MTQKKSVLEVPVWKLALRFMISFGFVLAIILLAAELFKSGNFSAIPQSFKDGSWLPFIGIRLAVIVGYGFIMAFLTRNKAKNNQ